jgi:uncharacterized membrane protein YfcA
MKEAVIRTKSSMLPLWFPSKDLNWVVIGGGELARQQLITLLQHAPESRVTVIAEEIEKGISSLVEKHKGLHLVNRAYSQQDLNPETFLVITTENKILDEKIAAEARQLQVKHFLPLAADQSDFVLEKKYEPAINGMAARNIRLHRMGETSDRTWRSITSKLILAFLLMVLGHIIISYLPFPSWASVSEGLKPYFNYQFLFFVLAGFLAQMVDGVLSMGYGVTSATCLMSFGVNPVAMSAAIHTSEIFTTGVSGYSHYRFKNVNKKLFRHLVIPGALGAILGALLLVYLGEAAGKWLMPVIAVYAGFLGLKILIKAFVKNPTTKKVKRVGWLAWIGGFLDSFGGGGWGPIVTSTLISKGRSPRYTVGSVSLTEFFVTLSSAFTFFITVGISHWNIVLGLLIGGSLAAPIAAKLAGRLPKKTMMIAVGIMVMIWCIRMIVKSFA